MSLSHKIIENRQKRNLMGMHDQLSKNNLQNSIVRSIYYPESSDILKIALQNMNSMPCQKEAYISPSPDCERRLAKYLTTLSTCEKTVLCFFPNYSPQANDIISDLPIFEILSDSVDDWYELATGNGLHFFLCSSSDLRHGIALDFFEADPTMHRTAGAVCELYYWNN